MRTTRIRRFDKSLATVPNQTFTNTAIVNHSKRPMRRLRVVVGLGYETPPAQMQAFVESVRALLAETPALDPASNLVYFNELGVSSLNVLVQGFTLSTDFLAFMQTQEAILLRLMTLVEEQGLEIAFPTRTVYFRDEHRQPAGDASDGQPVKHEP
jgi:MscS family membrane protein